MAEGTQRNLTSCRDLLQSIAGKNPFQRGFMLSGALINDVKCSLQFSGFNRLCIPVPFPGDRIFEADDEYIFKLYRYTGNHLQYKS